MNSYYYPDYNYYYDQTDERSPFLIPFALGIGATALTYNAFGPGYGRRYYYPPYPPYGPYPYRPF